VEMPKKTNCYTYKVEMIVQVLSSAEHFAKVILEERGGYVSSRKVTLLNSFELYEDFEVDKEKDISSEPKENEDGSIQDSSVSEVKEKKETILETSIDEDKNNLTENNTTTETKDTVLLNLEIKTEDISQENKS
jgi:hypothetical protein